MRPAAADTLEWRYRQLARLAGFPTAPFLIDELPTGRVPDAELDFGLGTTGAIWRVNLGGYAESEARRLSLASDHAAWGRRWEQATEARFRARADTLWMASLNPPRIPPN